MSQVRLPVRFLKINFFFIGVSRLRILNFLQLDDVAGVISDLARSRITWKEVQGKYPKFEQQEFKEE